ncbi:hypothetical protein, partial [Sutcliffiella horikoshii]|uniref:hypothetical protein n=1 Tax=Sutcliffiella horikoshii TaxID=79883 RepID=UPI003CEA7A1D
MRKSNFIKIESSLVIVNGAAYLKEKKAYSTVDFRSRRFACLRAVREPPRRAWRPLKKFLILDIVKTPLLISANGFAFRGATLSLLTSLRGLNNV